MDNLVINTFQVFSTTWELFFQKFHTNLGSIFSHRAREFYCWSNWLSWFWKKIR